MITSDQGVALSATERTRIRRRPDREITDRSELYAILDAGFLCHLAVVIDGVPRVIPTGYGRDGDVIYIHGSAESLSLMTAGRSEVCVAVTHLDGVVLARSMFRHSINYRSAMIYGQARAITDPGEKLAALRVVSESMAPGQWDIARHPDSTELSATGLIAVPLDEASVKVGRRLPAVDEPDQSHDIWAGVLPIKLSYGKPISSTPDKPVSANVSGRAEPDYQPVLPPPDPSLGSVRRK